MHQSIIFLPLFLGFYVIYLFDYFFQAPSPSEEDVKTTPSGTPAKKTENVKKEFLGRLGSFLGLSEGTVNLVQRQINWRSL